MITKEQALALDEFHTSEKGKCRRWRRNGQTTTWKTRPNNFSVPVKHGLYSYSYVFFFDGGDGNAHLFHAAEDCPTAELPNAQAIAYYDEEK